MGAAHLAQKIQQFESPTPITWKQYLVDGHLHEWEGEMEKVYSPMGPISAEGKTQRHYLGEAPTLNEEAGLTALAAAKKHKIMAEVCGQRQALQNVFLLWKCFWKL